MTGPGERVGNFRGRNLVTNPHPAFDAGPIICDSRLQSEFEIRGALKISLVCI